MISVTTGPDARLVRTAAILIVLVGVPPASARALVAHETQASRQVTLEDIRELATIGWSELSPDGSRIAYEVESTDPEEQGLWLVEVDAPASEKPTRLLPPGAVSEMAGWSADGTLGFLERIGSATTVRTMEPGRPPRAHCSTERAATKPAWAGREDGSRIAFVAPADAPMRTAVFVCDLSTGAIERATNESYFAPDFAWSPDGEMLAVSAQREPGFYGALESDLYVLDVLSGDTVAAVERAGVDRSPAWSPDGSRVAFVTGFGQSGLVPNLGISVLTTLEPALHDIGRSHDRGGFFEGPWIHGWSLDSRRVFFSVVDGVETPLWEIAANGGAPTRLSDGWAGPGEQAHDYRTSPDGRTVTFARSSTDRSPDLYAVVQGRGKPYRITRVGRSLTHLGVPRAEIVSWTAPDGMTLQGLLLRPRPGSAEALPLVTVLHGGPASAYGLAFPGLQYFSPYQDLLLAARGYAVFLPNPRGSGGYGQAFRAAALRDWAHGPAADVLSGVDHLVNVGVADPGRLALAGWSYGGYLAAWILTRTPRFRAASVGAGIVDLTSHFGQAPEQMTEYFGGPPWSVPGPYRRQSPVSWADRFDTPTLVFHGEADSAVSPAQSELLVAALRTLGVPVQYRGYRGEGHSFRGAVAQDESWAAFLGWVERWLGTALPGA